MTRAEFRRLIPDFIEHSAHGYGELEIIVDRPGKVGVCYRHRNKTASYGTYGKDWQEVYDDLSNFMIK